VRIRFPYVYADDKRSYSRTIRAELARIFNVVTERRDAASTFRPTAGASGGGGQPGEGHRVKRNAGVRPG